MLFLLAICLTPCLSLFLSVSLSVCLSVRQARLSGPEASRTEHPQRRLPDPDLTSPESNIPPRNRGNTFIFSNFTWFCCVLLFIMSLYIPSSQQKRPSPEQCFSYPSPGVMIPSPWKQSDKDRWGGIRAVLVYLMFTSNIDNATTRILILLLLPVLFKAS